MVYEYAVVGSTYGLETSCSTGAEYADSAVASASVLYVAIGVKSYSVAEWIGSSNWAAECCLVGWAG